MKISDYGKTSLIISLISWTIGVGCTILSWSVIAIIYENHKVGDPKPESIFLNILQSLAFLALPGAMLAIVIGFMALNKNHSRLRATISIFLSIPLFLVFIIGFWTVWHGGV